MRRSLPLALLLLTTACGGQPQQQRTSSESLRTFDVAEDTAHSVSEPPPPAAPSISPTAAPGVAFNYRYAFRLPAVRVAGVQEQHAQACEKLGLDRCRITGMRYRLINERDIEAMLALKLDPAIARQFGKTGIETVRGAEGMLVDSEISGVDVGSGIKAANRNDLQLNEDLRRIEAQLARPGLKPEERAQLLSEAQQLRASIRANRANREDQQESLATTPMTFQYGSGDLVPGFDTHSPFRTAIEQAGDNFLGGVAMLLVIFVTLLPWALILLLVWWLFRLLRRRFPSIAQRPQSSDELS